MTLFIAKFLDFEALGLFGLLTATTTMAPSLIGFGVAGNISRYAITESHQIISDAIRHYSKFIISLYSVIACIICVLYYGGYLSNGFILLCLALIFFEHMNSDYYTLYLNLSRTFEGNIFHFLRAASWGLIYMIVALIFPALRTIEALCYFWLTASSLTFILFSYRYGFVQLHDIVNFFSISFIRYTYQNIRSSWMIYLNMLITTLSQYSDRYVIGFFLGLKLTGIYIFFWQISSAIANLLFTGVLQIYRPKIVKAFKDNDKAYKKIIQICSLHTFIGTTFFCLSASVILFHALPYLDKPEIENNIHIGWIIFFSLIIHMLGEVSNLVFYSRHLDKLFLELNLKVLLSSFIVTIPLIYFFGLIGAALSFLFYGAIQLVLKWNAIYRSKIYTIDT